MTKGKYTTWLEPDNLTRLKAWARDGPSSCQLGVRGENAEHLLRQMQSCPQSPTPERKGALTK